MNVLESKSTSSLFTIGAKYGSVLTRSTRSLSKPSILTRSAAF
jgi:hypothetical protein